MELLSRTITRKEMLKMGLLGGAALMLPLERKARTQLSISNRIPESQLPEPFQLPFAVPTVAAIKHSDATTDYYTMTMKQAQLQILPKSLFGPTTVYGYDGLTPGPTIHARKGRKVVVRHINQLPEVSFANYKTWTSVHLHGSASLPQYDGYASDITNPGEFKDYHYPNIQPARTLWYHDHGVHHTAENAYMGCAAQYHIHDEQELSLPIPHGEYDASGKFVPSKYDVPLILRDAIFAQNGDFVYDDQGHSSLYGDVILTNGVPWPVMQVERRKYRFRVLDASISRSYRLALSTGDPFTVIATDAGLMPAPQQTDQLRIGQAERYEIVIDFARYRPGQQIVLQNLSNPNNQDFDSTSQIMRFDVLDSTGDPNNNEIPSVLNPGTDEFYNPMPLKESDATGAAHLEVIRKNGLWTVNGQTWEDVIDSDYKLTVANPKLDQVQVWTLKNPSGGWFHPLHIHLIDGQILDRNGKPPFDYEKGPKDVFYLGENETVRVLIRFGPQTGRYMVHCHNLVHEDHDMMVQFNVGDAFANRADDPNDPILAASAKPISEMGPLWEEPGNGGGGGETTTPEVTTPEVTTPETTTPATVKPPKKTRKRHKNRKRAEGSAPKHRRRRKR
ncbi:MAG TPA: multicopper oxidase domain-containing protein [Rubrobacteraceae bacterium]|nr:multicopper oxidase domain-containing protein [Rubrobacteraceae bacterium]